jgi:hypothetical protein
VVTNEQARRVFNLAIMDLCGFHGGTISRKDVAKFVLDEMQDDDKAQCARWARLERHRHH